MTRSIKRSFSGLYETGPAADKQVSRTQVRGPVLCALLSVLTPTTHVLSASVSIRPKKSASSQTKDLDLGTFQAHLIRDPSRSDRRTSLLEVDDETWPRRGA